MTHAANQKSLMQDVSCQIIELLWYKISRENQKGGTKGAGNMIYQITKRLHITRRHNSGWLGAVRF